ANPQRVYRRRRGIAGGARRAPAARRRAPAARRCAIRGAAGAVRGADPMRGWRAGVAYRWLGVVLLVASAGCSRHDADDQGSGVGPTVPVRAEPLATRAFEDAIEAGGQWKSRGNVVVAAPFPGVLESLTVHVGDPVRAGQAIGSLSTAESRAALRGAALLLR